MLITVLLFTGPGVRLNQLITVLLFTGPGVRLNQLIYRTRISISKRVCVRIHTHYDYHIFLVLILIFIITGLLFYVTYATDSREC